MAIATLKMVTLDTTDASRDAAFWHAVLDWDITHDADGYAMLTGPGGLAVGFGSSADHEAPTWPNAHGSKQFHFDLATDDIDEAARRCVELGATLPEDQPGETWRVLIDPGGHPFCLTLAANWG